MYYFILALIFFSQNINSQEFKWKSEIEPITKNGFTKIKLNSTISVKSDFSDLRLYDEVGNEIPYFLKTDSRNNSNKIFNEYKIISKSKIKGKTSELIVQSNTSQSINNLSLVLKNSDVQKEVRLLGSDNQKDWYIIKDNYLFQSIYSVSETTEFIQINFPLSNYHFYKIEMNDENSAPINILKVGHYINKINDPTYSTVNGLTFNKIDSSEIKQSFIKFNLKNPQLIHKINFQIPQPHLFKRNAYLAYLVVDTLKHAETINHFEPIEHFELSSESTNELVVSNLTTENLYFIIENEDNPPLEIKNILLHQLNTYLIADLKKENHYVLKFGNSKLDTPSYDLKHFQNKIPTELPIIKSLKIENIIESKNLSSDNSTFLSDKKLLWFVIVIVILLLSFLSYKMIKDMKP